jgi:short chain dehydrogenase
VAAETGGRVLAVAADLTDPAAVKAAVARIRAELGRIDILVNKAGGDIGPAGATGPRGASRRRTIASSSPSRTCGPCSTAICSNVGIARARFSVPVPGPRARARDGGRVGAGTRVSASRGGHRQGPRAAERGGRGAAPRAGGGFSRYSAGRDVTRARRRRAHRHYPGAPTSATPGTRCRWPSDARRWAPFTGRSRRTPSRRPSPRWRGTSSRFRTFPRRSAASGPPRACRPAPSGRERARDPGAPRCSG